MSRKSERIAIKQELCQMEKLKKNSKTKTKNVEKLYKFIVALEKFIWD